MQQVQFLLPLANHVINLNVSLSNLVLFIGFDIDCFKHNLHYVLILPNVHENNVHYFEKCLVLLVEDDYEVLQCEHWMEFMLRIWK